MSDDKLLFCEILKPYAEILRSAGKSTAVLRKKQEAWDEIANRYNAQSLKGEKTNKILQK